MLTVPTVSPPKRIKRGFRGVIFKSSYFHEYSSKNVRKRFKIFFINEDIFWKKFHGMKNYLDSNINFRKKIVFVKMPQKRQNSLKNVGQKMVKKWQKNRFLGHLYQILLREFKVARIILNRVREFMYRAKMMVREL